MLASHILLRRSLSLSLLLALVLSLGAILPSIPVAQASGTITGTVFRDFDSDGVFDAGEQQVAGVTVTAYDSAGVARGTTTTVRCTANNTPSGVGCTGADTGSNYSLTATGAGPYRIEFTNLPGGYQASARSSDSVNGSTSTTAGSTVQFVQNGNTNNVNVGVILPNDYCQTNPYCATSTMENGSGASNTHPGYKSFPVSGSGTTSVPASPAPTTVAQVQQVGSVWGNAFQRQTKTLFTSAYLRRHVGFGPAGIGGVYRLNMNTATGSGSVAGSFTLQGVTPSNSGTAINLGSVTRSNVTGGISAGSAGDNQLSSVTTNPNRDLDAFAKVGTMSFGDSDLSEDGNTLWLVNLNQKTLIAVDVSDLSAIPTNGSAVSGSLVKTYPISGATGVPTCTNGNLRPWGLKLYREMGYLGVVCDAATGTMSNLVGHVLSFNPSNPSSFTQEVSIPLNYSREVSIIAGPVYDGFGNWADQGLYTSISAAWQRWISTWPATANGQASTPQPLISDIEFDVNGNMTLGLMDRYSIQAGNENFEAISGSTTLNSSHAAGDILNVCKTGGSWSVECTDSDNNTSVSPIPDDGGRVNDGPSSTGEFYYNDWFYNRPTPDNQYLEVFHWEIALGGLAYNRAANEVATTVFDAIGPSPRNAGTESLFRTNGVHWYNAANGAKNRGYQIQTSTPSGSPETFGKANGLGDLEVLCDPAPIELGSRVWNDANGNGLQDAGEAGIQNVTVGLYTSGGTLITTAGTDVNGEYYFSSATGTNATYAKYGLAITSNTAYEVRILNAVGGSQQAALSGLGLTTANVAQPANGNAADTSNNSITDVADSDASISGANAVIAYTTGGPGSNNHGLDFGFTPSTDYGDAPDTGAGTATGNYNTTAADNGPSHAIIANLRLGVVNPDADDGTLQNTAATADDLNNTDDEDGVSTLPAVTTISTTVPLSVNVFNNTGSTATLACWVDFNRDGDFLDTGERASATVNTSASQQNISLTFTGFAAPSAGTSYLRCRVANASGEVTNPTGSAVSGEVEDYQLSIAQSTDYGDAPDTGAGTGVGNYNTTAADNGPSHAIIANLRLGVVNPDPDSGTLQNAAASADDTNNTDDEDGVSVLPAVTTISTTVPLSVNVFNNTGSTATLACWVDFNRDGDFLDTGERASATVNTSASQQNISLTFTGFAAPSAGTSYLRCRVANASGEVTNPTGSAVSGEVEDYQLSIAQLPISLTGTVFDDANGSQVQDGGEPGTNVGGLLYVSLVDSSGNVTATTPVDANGLYTFTNVTPNTTYTLTLSTITSTIGSPAPVVTLPSNWVTTGENDNGTPDGTPNSLLTAVVVTSDVIEQNFGIEQLPDSDDKTEPAQINPGGTISVTVPALSGSDPEDGVLGTGMTLTITSLATNGTLYYDNLPVTLNQVITNYDPSKLTVDPVDGTVTVTFEYAVYDAAGEVDPTPATVTMPFIVPDYALSKTLNTPSPVRVGETISFTIRITNTGPVTLTTVPLRDTYVAGVLAYVSAVPQHNAFTPGQVDWTDLTAAGVHGFGYDLAPGQSFSVTVTFVGLVDTSGLPGGVTINTATVQGVFYDPDGPGGVPPQPVPNKPPVEAPVAITAPTAVALADAGVGYGNAQAALRWRTVSESNVLGFHIYRSEDGEATVRLTAEMIPAQKTGQSDGAAYAYTDKSLATGKSYSYTVELVGVNGLLGQSEIGTIFSGGRIFLPTVER